MPSKPLDMLLQEMTGRSRGSVGVDAKIHEREMVSLKNARTIARAMYPSSPVDRLNYWKSSVKLDSLSQQGKAAYWDMYGDLDPDGPDGAKKAYVNVTLRELSVLPTASEKEHLLRERISTAPKGAQKDLSPLLGVISTANANANLAKASYSYSQGLGKRMTEFLGASRLDPDVAIADHVEDFLRVEQAELMGVATVVDGRLAVPGKQGMTPVFSGLPSASVPSDTEQASIRSLATDAIRRSVEDNVFQNRKELAGQEKSVSLKGKEMLSSGEFTMDRWADAFALMPDTNIQHNIELGLQGEIAAGRIRTDKELARAVFAAHAMHPTIRTQGE